MSLIGAMIKTYVGGKISHDKIIKLQNKRLKKLVKYAKENSSYFKKKYNGIDDNFKLNDLPITNKIDLMENFNDWLTDKNINLNKINEFTSNIDNVGRMIDGKYLIFKTSGSTGNPVTILYDKNNIDVSSAVAAFRTFARREDFKRFMKNGKKTAGVFANYGFYLACGMSRYLELKMPNKKNKITIDVNADEDEIIDELNRFNPSMLSGYPSNLSLLSDSSKLKISPDVIITGGELLTDDVRDKLSKRFNCYVQTHYSCTEVGEIACECVEGHLHINEDYVIVEPVDKDNNPVSYGVQSDKILVTNLANYIQPIIRYELTDRVILHNEKCKCGKNTYWLEVEGRTDDILEFSNGKLIAPMSFYKIISKIEEINRFQLIQRTKNILELRIDAKEREKVFEIVKNKILEFLSTKNIDDVEIYLSLDNPQANKSGKYVHVYKDIK